MRDKYFVMSFLRPTLPSSMLQLRVAVSTISFLLSVIVILTDDLINSDGILYVEMTRAFLEDGLQGTGQLFNWPFYSILAAAVSKITTLSALNSLYLINTVFFVLLTDALVLIIRRLMPSFKLTVITSLLLVSFFTLNEYREYVIRDIGYWALSFAALYQFICTLENNKLSNLLYWQALTILAFLFRIEAIVMLLCLPFLLILELKDHKIKRFLQSYSLVFLLAVTAVITMTFMGEINTSSFSKFYELWRYLAFDDLMHHLTNNARIIDEHIIADVAEDKGQGIIVLLSGFFGLLSIELMIGISIGYLVLTGVALKTPTPHINKSVTRVLAYALLLQISILYIFSLKAHFMSTRYCILAIVLLLLLLSPKLSRWIELSFESKAKTSQFMIIAVLIFSVGDAIHYTGSKRYIRDASTWVSQTLTSNDKIYTNSPFVHFYLRENNPNLHLSYERELTSETTYDYFLLDSREISPALAIKISSMPLEAIKSIGNKNHVTLYRVGQR